MVRPSCRVPEPPPDLNKTLAKKIVVPFPVESSLSGEQDVHPALHTVRAHNTHAHADMAPSRVNCCYRGLHAALFAVCVAVVISASVVLC